MKTRNTLIPLFTLLLTVGANQNAVAGKVYQWTDKEGGIHFGNVPPEETATRLVYRKATGESIYQWTDEEGRVYFGDIPPEETSTIAIREVKIDRFDDSLVDSDRYSVINQAQRMAERRRQLEEVRLYRKRLRLEEKQITGDLAVLRQLEKIRTQGYGPRPYYAPYPHSYDDHMAVRAY